MGSGDEQSHNIRRPHDIQPCIGEFHIRPRCMDMDEVMLELQ